ncbi:MAG: GAF and HD-GYP domain-containing protein [Spirochaetota bacterium]
MRNEVEQLREIIRLDTELSTVQDLDILLERILSEARHILNADAGSIYLREHNDLVFSYVQNDTQQKKLPPGQKLIYSTFRVEINTRSISGYVATTGEVLNIPDVYQIPGDSPYQFNPSYDRVSGYRTHSMLTVPLKTNLGDIVGVLQIINKQEENGSVIPFSTADEIVVRHFAGTASMAIQRARLTRALILRMIQMIELRDPKETGPHVNRVAAYSIELYEQWARRRTMSTREINKKRDVLRMAAMLHDVGKVAVSDIILKKPGALTPKERTIMKSHTYLGARLFMDRHSEFDDVASQVALTHHENWDGTGYPGRVDIRTGKPLNPDRKGMARTLKREEIPIYGRVVALADVYDALRSHRVYKKAWDEEEVLHEMQRLAGSKFDPELVDIFFESLETLKSISARYPD